MTISTRLLSTGTLLVNGQFDEYTFQKGSALFDGSTNYLSTASNDTAFVTGANNFTIEAWIYPTTTNVERGISNTWQTGGSWVWKILNTNLLQLIFTNVSGGGVTFTTTTSGNIAANTWTHLATVRSNNTITHYINGIADPITANVTGQTMYGFTKPFRVGVSADLGSKFSGYISNFRFVNGSAVYTGNFTPPRAPLTAVANTTALFNTVYNLANVNAFNDNSVTNAVVINNSNVASTNFIPPFAAVTTRANAVLANQFDEVTINAGNVAKRDFANGTTQISGVFDEFTGAPVADTSLMVWVDAAQPTSYSGSGTTWTDLSGNGKNYTLGNAPAYNSTFNGGAITFTAASSQYANTAASLYNSTTFPAYTINLWVYPTGAGNFVQVDGQTTPNTGYVYSAIEIAANGNISFGQWTGAAIATIATSAQSLNAWYNLVITYSNSSATAYVNGVSVGTSATTWTAPGSQTFMALMAPTSTNMGTNSYASGNIGAFMVYNRALNSDEIQTNFNALRGRYGR